ncbi:hypothetical protein BDZ88DRAFT_21983 [Geranomyces variabilis]|nr:hypothetical protein BDZ88DRAFT_21983 [Geranomyces variabilis]KAJ3140133.1 hypothetical protein HDU90_008357 [Geranomyces variabilis]
MRVSWAFAILACSAAHADAASIPHSVARNGTTATSSSVGHNSTTSAASVTPAASSTVVTRPAGGATTNSSSSAVAFAEGMGTNCAVCSYRNRQRFVFRSCNVANPGQKMRPAGSLGEWATFLGDGWTGHSVCCDEDLSGHSQRKIEVVTFKNGMLRNTTAVVKPLAEASNTTYLDVPVVPTTANQTHVDRLTAAHLGPDTRTRTKRDGVTDASVFTKPAVCLPLVSVNPVGNPYHPSLVGGVKDVNLRAGQGFPVPLGIGRKCEPPEVPPCESSWTLTRSWTSSLSFTVNKGSQQSITNTLGKSKSTGDESSTAEAISDTLEQSVSHTSTKERGGSSSDTVATTLTKTTEVSLANTHTAGTESSTTDTTNEEETNNLSSGGSLGSSLNLESGGSHTAGTENSHTHTADDAHTNGHSDGTNENHEKHWEAGGGAGGSIFGISLGVQASGGHSDSTGKNHEDSSSDTHSDQNADTNGSSSSDTTNSNINFGMNSQANWEASQGHSMGHSTANTNGHSESDSTESRRSDSTSDALTNSHTDEANWSNSEADTVGNSHSHTFGKTNTYSTSHTLSEEQSEAKASVSTLENSQQQGVDLTSTLAQTWISKIELHACILPVMFYNTRSLHIPWACKNEDKETEIFSTEIATLDVARASISMGDMDCNVATVDFQINNADFETALSTGPTASALSSGQTLDVGKHLVAGTENEYSLTMEFDGQLTFKHFNDLIWTSDTGYLAGYSPRARITDDGHFIIEAKNIFSKVNYRMGNYTTVWSTVPKHLGTFTVGYKGTGYKLVVQPNTAAVLSNDQAKPDVVLYDAKGSPLWMASNPKFRNHLGFKHPLNYLVPTDMVTGPNLPNQADVHNAIDPSITFLPTNTLMSRDTGCNVQLNSGQGLQSPNGRFKLFLDTKGNLVHKDGPRTMWESYTSDLWFAIPPYSLRLNGEGEAYIADSQGHRIWQSMNYFMSTKRPFKAQITDDGGFTVVDAANAVVFDNSPLQKVQNLTFTALFTQPRIPCDSVCKDGCRPPVVQQLMSNATFDAVPNRQLWDGESLVSNDKKSSLTSVNGTLLFTSPALDAPKAFYTAATPNAGSTLEIFKNGTLQFNDPQFKILYTTAGLYPAVNSTYSVYITDEGFLTVADGSTIVWQFPDTKPVRELVSDTKVDHINSGQSLISPDGAVSLLFGPKGIQLSSPPSAPLMLSSVGQAAGTRLVLKTDGVLASIDGKGASTGFVAGTPNAGVAPYKLDVYDINGIAVAITDVNGVITWQFPPVDPPKRLTSTTSGPVPGALANYPDRILVGQKISSPSGAHSLFFTASGIALDSMVICSASIAIDSWLIMQSDGNILVKDPAGKVSCATGSTNRGTGPFTLAVDDTGYAFMTDSLGVVQWQYPESHLTVISSDGGVLANGISLSHRLWSPSNTYSVVMYGNGVFLARGDSVVATIYSGTLDWDSQILQQSDGNLVLTEGQAFKGWASNTWNAGTGPYKVRVSDVGAVLMTDSKDAVTWSFPPAPAALDWRPLTQMTNGKCISVGSAASVTAGDAATIQTCNGAANQQFGYDAQKGYLRSKLQPRLCLGVDSLAYLSAVKVRDCAFEDPNNKFTPDKDMVTSDVNKGLAFDNWNGISADGTPVVLYNTNAGDVYQHWKFGPFTLKPTSLDTNGVMSTSTGLWSPDGHITYKIDNQGRLVMLKDGKWNNVFLKNTGTSNYSGQGRIVIEQNGSISLYDGTRQYYNGGYRTGGTAPYHLRVGNDAKLQLVDNTGFAYWTASMS